MRARTGYYGPEHVARLRLIQDLQAEGFNLEAIERLIGRRSGDGERGAATSGARCSSAFAGEEPELATAEDLVARLGTRLDGRDVAGPRSWG